MGTLQNINVVKQSIEIGHRLLSSSVCVIGITSHKRYSSDSKFITKMSASALKRGRGGRSSFNGNIVTVFGATGFIGRSVCNRLGRIGTQLIMPYRGDYYDAMRLKLCGDLGQTYFHHYHLQDEASIRKSVKYSNAVVNLVGRDYETMNFNFDQVHVEGARRLARICKEMGVKQFIHMSALNSNMEFDGYLIPGGSAFLASKRRSEEAVLEEFPEAVIFRPSDVFGQEDRFLLYYAGMLRHDLVKTMALPNAGKNIWKQPVYVGDMAQAIVNVIGNYNVNGKIYEAVGPRRYELCEIVTWMHSVMRKDDEWGFKIKDVKWTVNDPFKMPIIKWKATLNDMLSTSKPYGYISMEKLEREAVTDTTSKLPDLRDLGVQLTKLEDRIKWELAFYKAYAHHVFKVGELSEPVPAKFVEA